MVKVGLAKEEAGDGRCRLTVRLAFLGFRGLSLTAYADQQGLLRYLARDCIKGRRSLSYIVRCNTVGPALDDPEQPDPISQHICPHEEDQ